VVCRTPEELLDPTCTEIASASMTQHHVGPHRTPRKLIVLLHPHCHCSPQVTSNPNLQLMDGKSNTAWAVGSYGSTIIARRPKKSHLHHDLSCFDLTFHLGSRLELLVSWLLLTTHPPRFLTHNLILKYQLTTSTALQPLPFVTFPPVCLILHWWILTVDSSLTVILPWKGNLSTRVGLLCLCFP
jgi:hypothetical protein